MGDGTGTVGLEDWPAYLKRMTGRAGWSVSRLARESGVHRATIHGYISGKKKGVTVATVTAIASALGDEPANALKAAGGATSDEVDEVIQLVVTDDRLTPQQKKRIIDMILDRRDRERAEERAEVQRLIEAFSDGQ